MTLHNLRLRPQNRVRQSDLKTLEIDWVVSGFARGSFWGERDEKFGFG
jgi:hypothetical protein